MAGMRDGGIEGEMSLTERLVQSILTGVGKRVHHRVRRDERPEKANRITSITVAKAPSIKPEGIANEDHIHRSVARLARMGRARSG